MEQFLEFVDRKHREAKKHLKLVERLLQSKGLDAKLHGENESDPYVFLKATAKLGFDGVRIYEIGDSLAFRVQKEVKTEPYGKAYTLNVEEMFNDFLGDEGVKEEEAGKKVIEAVADELRQFFDQSLKAEKEIRKKDDIFAAGISQASGVNDYGAIAFGRFS